MVFSTVIFCLKHKSMLVFPLFIFNKENKIYFRLGWFRAHVFLGWFVTWFWLLIALAVGWSLVLPVLSESHVHLPCQMHKAQWHNSNFSVPSTHVLHPYTLWTPPNEPPTRTSALVGMTICVQGFLLTKSRGIIFLGGAHNIM